jgi:hypothetical protein
MIMFAGRAIGKALLVLLGILATIMGPPTPGWAKGGIWWYGNNKWFNITLINLTEHRLITTYVDVDVSMQCFPDPFEHYGVNVEPYGSAIWLNEVTDLVWLMHYDGKMTFLPQGMDDKWKFNLNFTSQNGSGSTLGEGTWVYLTASDTVNTGWVPSWDTTQVPDQFYRGYLGYATRMNDGKPRNLMNLQAEEIGMAVSVYSPNNTNIVVVVQTVDKTDTYYEAWKLDWADNSQNSLPH